MRGSCCSVSSAPPFWAASSLKGVPASPLSGSGSGPSAGGLKADGCALALLSLPRRPEQGSRDRMGDHCSPPCHGTCVGKMEQYSFPWSPLLETCCACAVTLHDRPGQLADLQSRAKKGYCKVTQECAQHGPSASPAIASLRRLLKRDLGRLPLLLPGVPLRGVPYSLTTSLAPGLPQVCSTVHAEGVTTPKLACISARVLHTWSAVPADSSTVEVLCTVASAPPCARPGLQCRLGPSPHRGAMHFCMDAIGQHEEDFWSRLQGTPCQFCISSCISLQMQVPTEPWLVAASTAPPGAMRWAGAMLPAGRWEALWAGQP